MEIKKTTLNNQKRIVQLAETASHYMNTFFFGQKWDVSLKVESLNNKVVSFPSVFDIEMIGIRNYSNDEEKIYKTYEDYYKWDSQFESDSIDKDDIHREILANNNGPSIWHASDQSNNARYSSILSNLQNSLFPGGCPHPC